MSNDFLVELIIPEVVLLKLHSVFLWSSENEYQSTKILGEVANFLFKIMVAVYPETMSIDQLRVNSLIAYRVCAHLWLL